MQCALADKLVSVSEACVLSLQPLHATNVKPVDGVAVSVTVAPGSVQQTPLWQRARGSLVVA
jgi:hypothetical protein